MEILWFLAGAVVLFAVIVIIFFVYFIRNPLVR